MANIKFDQFTPGGYVQTGDIVVGLRSGDNAQFNIAPAAGFSWFAVTGTSQLAQINSGYISTDASPTTFTLPAIAPIGSMISIQGQGSGGWVIDAAGSQIIRIGASASSAGGTVSSANRYDAITLICIVADTEWAMYGPVSSGFVIT